MAKLSVVATPIGNMSDITLRAIDVLRTADMVLCEDTRVTHKLLAHHSITTKLESFHEHSAPAKMTRILACLEQGMHLALVTDAGTPCVSDPGARLVAAVRKQLPHVGIETVPGPSALSAFIAISGLTQTHFIFLGFLPHKKGRATVLREIAASARPVVFYESPHRLTRVLGELASLCAEKCVVIGRELTKRYEEILTGTPAQLLDHFNKHPDSVRGECTIMVSTTGSSYYSGSLSH